MQSAVDYLIVEISTYYSFKFQTTITDYEASVVIANAKKIYNTRLK